MENTKILIAYYSETGNTIKVAQAIHEEIMSQRHEVHLMEISKIAPDDLNTYDLVFLGSPCHDANLARPVKHFLEQIPTSSSLKLGGFVTHASYTPTGGERQREVFNQWASPSKLSFLQVCQAKGIDFLGYFSCQGVPSPPIEQFIHDTIVTDEGEWSEYIEEVRKHPNSDDFQKARQFAQEILIKCVRLIPIKSP
jgi:flavodoxin